MIDAETRMEREEKEVGREGQIYPGELDTSSTFFIWRCRRPDPIAVSGVS